MFPDIVGTLSSFRFNYVAANGKTIGVRVYNDDYCLLEDSLCDLLDIELKQLYDVINILFEEKRIEINKDILLHGNAGSMVYKLKISQVGNYKEHLPGNCFDNDDIKVLVSSEAINQIMLKIVYSDIDHFVTEASSTLTEIKTVKGFIQGIICGVDDSISKIHFGDKFTISEIKTPEFELPIDDSLKLNWFVFDIFSYFNKFANARLPLVGHDHTNTLLSKTERILIKQNLDGKGNLNMDDIAAMMTNQRINQMTNIFKIIRLICKKPIWCSEIARIVSTWGVCTPETIKLSDPYQKYSLQDIYTISDKEAIRINHLIPCFIDNPEKETMEESYTYYDYSFFVPDDVAIVLLVTCLEILFHPGDKEELKYRVARNTAIFLGDETLSSEEVFENVKNFYNIRSALVHSGKFEDKKTKKTQKEIINELRFIVSEAIIKYYYCIAVKNVNRNTFFDVLNSSGFNSTPYKEEKW